MPIIFHKNTKEFHLYNDEISYIFCILRNGQPGQIYYGRKIKDRESFQHLIEYSMRDMAPCTYEGDRTFSMEYLKQEYPSYGHGDMREPAYEILQEDGSRITEFTFEDYVILKGKRKLEGLPAVYTESDEEAETLEIYLRDRVMNTKIILSYTIFENLPVIIRNTRFVHEGESSIVLERAMSLNLDLPDDRYEMVELTGAWARERYVKTAPLHEGIQAIYSMRGHSSHQFNPFFALKRPETTEDAGEAIGISLVYSGNFLGQTAVDTFGVARAMIGIHPEGFSWTLKKGETFQTPEAVLVYSGEGLGKMSRTFHRLYRKRLARGYWRDRVRPVVINNWEATFMNFTEEKILKFAETARQLGVEMMVLDDGWFGHRDDDTSSLGDWYPDLKKLPQGIRGLAEKIENMGMKFGLWIEPEMVNKDSRLYEEHPDWVIRVPYREACHGRNQFVLDFSKEEVVDYIGDRISRILQDAPVSYIKWDMNRSISEAFSQGRKAEEQGKLFHRHILGVYRLYERLTSEFPEVLFESCASGGARFDPGMLYYAPQCWTSDNTDAVERLRIQYGTSFVYPLSSMGCHVSEAPNQQTFRNTPLSTRAETAYFGCFGYEMDLDTLTEEEKEEVKEQIQYYKRIRKLVMDGTFYRLISPFEGDEAAWMVVSEDKRHALAGYYRMRQPANAPLKRLTLKGLDPDVRYQIRETGLEAYGDELMRAGMAISDYASGIREKKERQGDYQSRLFELTAQS
ncbi:alpha-galactosidase [Sellimonas catena]|uniref:Alpha-galactosidase n=1 Tax=Sellimonas catena TaxID=2994035 RepID=A0A9W6C6E4_9FIRM|nr:alpha-galactosidase [Sellimonas catena]GLG04632.1 alpha-galactosidase [Sellimonas catena]